MQFKETHQPASIEAALIGGMASTEIPQSQQAEAIDSDTRGVFILLTWWREGAHKPSSTTVASLSPWIFNLKSREIKYTIQWTDIIYKHIIMFYNANHPLTVALVLHVLISLAHLSM